MAEFKAGDRVVKMSGMCAGKYGTVNSVSENGTLNVTFDGERLPRFCDPEKCGQVATNATKSRLKGFKVGDKVKDRHGNVGIVEKIQTDDAGPFGPPPSKYGDLLGIKIDGGRIGWLNETNAVLANSRAANGWPNARMKFKAGDKVRHKTNGLDGIVEGWASDPGQYRVRASGRVYEWDEDDLVLANAARNAKFKVGDKVIVKEWARQKTAGYGKGTIIKKVGAQFLVRPDEQSSEKYYVPTYAWDEDDLMLANSRVRFINAKFKVGDKIQIAADVGAWRKGENGTIVGGDYLPGYFYVKFDGGSEGRIPEDKMAARNSRAANACALDKGGRPVKEGDTIDTPKGLAEVVAIKMRPQGLKEVASYVGVTYTPGGRHVEEWLMADVHGTVRATLQNAARNAVARNGEKRLRTAEDKNGNVIRVGDMVKTDGGKKGKVESIWEYDGEGPYVIIAGSFRPVISYLFVTKV